ncbi:MAG: T9SS type A sorting domain-containing protein [Opitutaceae bacterium]
MIRGLLENSALAGVLAAAAVTVHAADVNVPRVINANTTWTADNTYFISGYSFVVTPSGATAPTVLTIEPGTVIKGRQKAGGSEGAALVISAGAQIVAEGTASNPIIFTSELDNLEGNLGIEDSNLWGGLVILGNATINSRSDDAVVAAPVTDQVEGFSVSGAEVDHITFGGTADTESSGTLRYVSIRHGGDALSTANEINGLTLGGVGSGTTVEYIEVFANKDDGIEFFGGTVDLRYAVTAFGRDDGFDYDQGWRGRGQFWFSIGATSNNPEAVQDKAGEWDGATSPSTATPAGGSAVFNATFIGNGSGSVNNTAINIRDAAQAGLFNSVVTEFNKGFDVENDAGTVDFESNIWWSHVTANNTIAGLNARPGGTFDLSALFVAAKDNIIANPALAGISRIDDGGLDPRPAEGSPALTGPFKAVPAGGWYLQTEYKGAFAPDGATWLDGWTKLSADGYLAEVEDGESGADFANISTRCFVGTGDSIAIPGFVIDGEGSKTVLIRAVGPELGVAPFNVAGVLADPVMDLKQNGASIANNDDWGSNANAAEIVTTSTTVGAFDLATGSTSAVLLTTLEPGSYTVTVSGKAGATGVVIVEVYRVD